MIELPIGSGEGVTWRALLDHATQLLTRAGVDSPAVDARWIVEDASGYEGGALLLALDSFAPTAGAAAYQRMTTRRLAGEPLQYVLGHWSFRTLDLAVDRRALIPRPETEVVAGIAIEEIRSLGARTVVDLGTGSGAIGLAIAVECPGVDVWLSDSSADALALARANLAGAGQAATRVRIAEGSWFDGLPPALRGDVGVVVSNPPYVADTEVLPAVVADWEPAAALRSGPTGIECYDAVIGEAPAWLARPGALVLEIAPHQVDEVERLVRGAGGVPRHGHDLAGRLRWVASRWDA